MEALFENDPRAAKEAMEGIIQSMPTGLPLPPAVSAAYGIIANEHPHFGSPIEPPFTDRTKPPYQVQWESSSEAGKSLTKFLAKLPKPLNQLSPAEFDFVAFEFTGRLGRHAAELSNILLRDREKVFPAPRPAVEQIFGRVYSERTPSEQARTKWRERFYDYYEISAKANSEASSPTGIYVYDAAEARSFEFMGVAQAMISAERKRLLGIINPDNDDYTSREKELEVRKSNQRRNEIAKRAVLRFERTQRAERNEQ